MPSDVTKDTFDRSKNYKKVLFSKQRSVNDFELNELQDILREKHVSLIRDGLGDGPVCNGFKVVPNPDAATPLENTFIVLAGDYYHLGHRISLAEDFIVPDDTLTATPITLTTPVGDRTDYVYVLWREREVDSTEDSDMLDPILLTETAVRVECEFNILVSEGAPIPPPTGNDNYFMIARLERPNGQADITEAEIVDERVAFAQNYVLIDPEVDEGSGLNPSYGDGKVVVGGTPYIVSAGSIAVPPSAETYIFVNDSGVMSQQSTYPTGHAAILALVTTSGTDVTAVEILSRCPPALRVGGFGETITKIIKIYAGPITAGEEIQPYDLVYIDSAGELGIADALSMDTAPAVGMVEELVPAGASGMVVLQGEVENTGWGFTPGVPLFLSSSGQMTEDPPHLLPGRVVQDIGESLDGDRIILNPSSIPRVPMGFPGRGFLNYEHALADLKVMAEDTPINSVYVNPTLKAYVRARYRLETDKEIVDWSGGPPGGHNIGDYLWVLLTLRDDGGGAYTIVQYHEPALGHTDPGLAGFPEMPSGEMPLAFVRLYNNGGIIDPIGQDDILDARPHLNLGVEGEAGTGGRRVPVESVMLSKTSPPVPELLNKTPTLDFPGRTLYPAGIMTEVYFSFPVPSDADTDFDIRIKVGYGMSSSNSASIRLGIDYTVVSESASLDPGATVNKEYSENAPNTLNIFAYTDPGQLTVNASDLSSNTDLVQVRLYRDGTADTHPGDWRVVSIEYEYTRL